MKTKLLIILTFFIISSLNAQTWDQVGTTQFTNTASAVTMANHLVSGETYLGFIDTSDGDKLYVKKYDGTNWVTVGTTAISASSTTIPSLAFHPTTNEPWIAYEQYGKLYVSKFNSTSNTWSLDANNIGTTLPIQKMQLVFNSNGDAYVAYGINPYVATVPNRPQANIYTNKSGSWVIEWNAIAYGRNFGFDYKKYDTFYKWDAYGSSGDPYSALGRRSASNWSSSNSTLVQSLPVVEGLATTKNGGYWMSKNTIVNSTPIIFHQNSTSKPSPINSENSKGKYIQLDQNETDGFIYTLFKNGNEDISVQKYDGTSWTELTSIGVNYSAVTSPYIKMHINSVTGAVFVAYQDNQKISVKKYAVQPSPAHYYVDKNASGNNDGTSWADAFTNLNTALAAANTHLATKSLWLAKGTYTPHASDKTKNFTINESVKLYGGFDGNETQLSQRDWRANETILSGDLNNNDSNTIAYNEGSRNDNAYRVVYIGGNNTVLDGVTISGGHGMHTSIVNYQKGAGIFKTDNVTSLNLKNCTIKNNIAYTYSGISAAFSTNATVNISKCIFENNMGRYGSAYGFRTTGGTTDVSIDNSLFTNNKAENRSANDGFTGSAGFLGIYTASATLNVTISNCTIADNVENGTHSALASPGVLATARHNGTLNTNIYNTIFWGNSRTGQTYQASALGRMNAANFSNTLNFTHNLLFTTSSTATINSYGTTVNQSDNVINHDPLWVSNTGVSRYRLTTSSLGYNSGDNTKVANEAEGDLAGLVRISESTVEMGAFEAESTTLSVQSNTLVSTTVYPNPTTNYVTIKSGSTINLVTIYSVTGKALSKIKNQNKIDLSTFPSGIYFLAIELDNQRVVKKIMKH